MNVHPSRKIKTNIYSKTRISRGNKKFRRFYKKLGFSEEIEVKTSKENIPQNAVNVVTKELEVFMPFEDLVNIEEEKQRLEKEKRKDIS